MSKLPARVEFRLDTGGRFGESILMPAIDPQKAPGAWIFLSHSHKDIEKVRDLRDSFEHEGHNPLMFFLKCLDDNCEIDDLIKREIQARNWFVFCKSKNSIASKWVQAELAEIKRYPDKKYEEIDLDANAIERGRKVKTFSKRVTVYLSYAPPDREVARRITNELRDLDYRVVDPEQIMPGENWQRIMAREIGEAATFGFVLVLLSRASIASHWIAEELRVASGRQGTTQNIIPVRIGDSWDARLLIETMGFGLREKTFELSESNFGRDLNLLVKDLKNRPIA
jgi:hypothetical protein